MIGKNTSKDLAVIGGTVLEKNEEKTKRTATVEEKMEDVPVNEIAAEESTDDAPASEKKKK